MALLLLPIMAVFILGIVSFFYGIQKANDNLLLLGVFLFRYHTYPVFRMGARDKQTQMKRIHFPGVRTPRIRPLQITRRGNNCTDPHKIAG